MKKSLGINKAGQKVPEKHKNAISGYNPKNGQSQIWIFHGQLKELKRYIKKADIGKRNLENGNSKMENWPRLYAT